MNIRELGSSLESQTQTDDTFLYLERFVNNFRGGWEKFSDVNFRYSPEGGLPVRLPFRAVDGQSFTTESAIPDNRLTQTVLLGDTACYFWHPDTGNPFEGEPNGYIDAVPTSSTRTLLTRGLPYNFFVKTHLPKRHFLYDRSLKPSVALHSVDVSRELLEHKEGDTTDTWGFMPESLALVLRRSGVVFREREAKPLIDEKRLLLPAFSLYSSDVNDPGSKPLLVQLIEQDPDGQPLDFLLNKIVGPLQVTWLEVLKQRGLLLELHAQNCLFELDRESNLRRVIVRDFQSIWSDIEIREKAGLPQLRRDGFEPEERAKQYSLCYDHFIGTMLLRHIVDSFTKHFDNYSQEEVNKLIAENFRFLAREILEYMPVEETFRMAHGPSQINGQGPISSGQPPVYR